MADSTRMSVFDGQKRKKVILEWLSIGVRLMICSPHSYALLAEKEGQGQGEKEG